MRRLRPTRLLRSPTTWLVLFAATAALAGTAVAGAVWSGTDAESTALRAAGGLSAATTTLVAWWLLLTRRSRYGIIRGAIAGGATGVAAYPLFWGYAIAMKAAVRGEFLRVGYLFGIGIAFGLTWGLFGIVVLGWFTGVIGGIAGGTLGALSKRYVSAGEESK